MQACQDLPHCYCHMCLRTPWRSLVQVFEYLVHSAVLLCLEPEIAQLEVGLEPQPVIASLLQSMKGRLIELLRTHRNSTRTEYAISGQPFMAKAQLDNSSLIAVLREFAAVALLPSQPMQPGTCCSQAMLSEAPTGTPTSALTSHPGA
eukprot:GHUV01028972.1.p1 GENE.GHUV01028972.1~~GHUV01028972.1.p1  ORF type:complete len:148 (+),score=21.40 GHUV01028972.1:832-1275(+)